MTRQQPKQMQQPKQPKQKQQLKQPKQQPDPAKTIVDPVRKSKINRRNQFVCDFCGSPASCRCSKCKTAIYCGSVCQATDWSNGHSRSCAALPRVLTGARLIAFHGHPGDDTVCSKAEIRNVVGSSHFLEGFFCYPTATQGSLQEFLTSLGSLVSVSDETFIQLSAASRGLLGPDEGGPLVFGTGPEFVWMNISRDTTAGYLALGDLTLCEALKISGIPSGIWINGPDKRGLYLGMSEKGPVRLSLNEWSKSHNRIIRHRLDDIRPECRQWLSVHLAVGAFNPDAYELFRKLRPETVSTRKTIQ